jgi:hypothetical protein
MASTSARSSSTESGGSGSHDQLLTRTVYPAARLHAQAYASDPLPPIVVMFGPIMSVQTVEGDTQACCR